MRSSREKFSQDTFLVIIKTLISELGRRMLAYSNVAKQFSVFFRDCLSDDGNNIRTAAERLVAASAEFFRTSKSDYESSYLCLMVTNCSGERSFSKLKRIKNELLSAMHQERLNRLTLMSLEHDVLQEIELRELIDKFAKVKSRKIPIYS